MFMSRRKALDDVELEPDGGAQQVVALVLERHRREQGRTVARHGSRLHESRRVDQIVAENVEHEREPLAHAEVRAEHVRRLVGKIRGLARRRIARERARAVPQVAQVDVR